MQRQNATGPLAGMNAQDPVLDNFRQDVIEAGHEDEITNHERGCGHVQHNSGYVRSDPDWIGSDTQSGIPRFVALDDPIEYREYSGRGAIIPGWRRFPGPQVLQAYRNDGRTVTPDGALEATLARDDERLAFDGSHYGEITACRAQDIIMSVGATHWDDPADYVQECRQQGLNLKVPTGPSNDPPVVNPFHTRCWVVHPHGVSDGRAGIIGWATLTRAIYTTGPDATPDDPDVPKYAEDWGSIGLVDLATPGPRQAPPDQNSDLDDFDLDQGGDGDE